MGFLVDLEGQVPFGQEPELGQVSAWPKSGVLDAQCEDLAPSAEAPLGGCREAETSRPAPGARRLPEMVTRTSVTLTAYAISYIG